MSSLLDNDWMIVGLGNPGPEYAKTRHNLGFMTVDLLAHEEQTQVKREECRALVGRALIGGKTVELVKPITYMNLSGDAVGCLMKKAGRSAERLIIISDDLALPLGKIRIRPKGSHGGHNGLRSIFDHLKTSDLIRLRIGITPDHPVGNTKDFVLRPFAGSEREAVERALEDSVDALRTILNEGVEAAMAKFN
ncbi:MAG: aminoacyl-tRNA hydrolase [Acidobacteria bacterium]|nr:aminoacyl-tRNA hydrolase [Acidobacteriota bacterium]